MNDCNCYINFKTGKLAKEKGFDIYSETMYTKNGDICDVRSPLGAVVGKYPRVLQSSLQKWLREEHNIDISIIVNYSHYKDGEITGKKTYRVGVIYIDDDLIETFFIRPKDDDFNFIEFNTYEEALEEGLYEALKLIKIKGNEYD
jgi:hypothetical protein